MPKSKTVRLTDREKELILKSVEEISTAFGSAWEEIALFGSRTDPQKKGGDIDLYLKLKSTADNMNFSEFKRKLLVRLKENLGDQKIDLLIENSSQSLGAFSQIVQESKVSLWTRK